MKTVSVKAQSDAYFRILEKHPEMKDVFRLGNHLVWISPSGTALVIDQNDGKEKLTDAEIDGAVRRRSDRKSQTACRTVGLDGHRLPAGPIAFPVRGQNEPVSTLPEPPRDSTATSPAATFLRRRPPPRRPLALAESRRAKAEDPFGGFTLGVQSYTFRNFDLEPALKQDRRNSASSTPSSTRSTSRPRRKPEQAQGASSKLCKEYEVTPVGFGVSSVHEEPRREQEAVRVRQGPRRQVPERRPDAGRLRQPRQAVRGVQDRHRASTRTGPSGKGKRHRWWSAEVILKAVKDHHKLIGTCLDTGHLIRMAQLGEKLDPAEQVKVMGDRNFGMHLKDHDNKRKTDVVFGDGGVLDVPAVLKALKEVKFPGTIAHRVRGEPERPVAGHEEVRRVREGVGEEARLSRTRPSRLYNPERALDPRGPSAGCVPLPRSALSGTSEAAP